MEQEKLPCTPPEQTPCGFDREVFERVWRRVMPEDRPDCPFVLDSSAAPAVPEGAEAGSIEPFPEAAVPQVRAQPPEVEAPPVRHPCAVPVPAEPAAPAAVCGCADNDVPCLGAASAVYGAQLQQFIDQELCDWRCYQLLAKRAPGGGGKALSSIAADERRHAKRLSTAYFLISGVRYWPAERMNAPWAPGTTYLSALRQRFADEQRGECAYLAAAEGTTDPCLQELYAELAGDENAHVWLIRGILEQL